MRVCVRSSATKPASECVCVCVQVVVWVWRERERGGGRASVCVCAVVLRTQLVGLCVCKYFSVLLCYVTCLS